MVLHHHSLRQFLSFPPPSKETAGEREKNSTSLRKDRTARNLAPIRSLSVSTSFSYLPRTSYLVYSGLLRGPLLPRSDRVHAPDGRGGRSLSYIYRGARNFRRPIKERFHHLLNHAPATPQRITLFSQSWRGLPRSRSSLPHARVG